jgi:hypothetical protein
MKPTGLRHAGVPPGDAIARVPALALRVVADRLANDEVSALDARIY